MQSLLQHIFISRYIYTWWIIFQFVILEWHFDKWSFVTLTLLKSHKSIMNCAFVWVLPSTLEETVTNSDNKLIVKHMLMTLKNNPTCIQIFWQGYVSCFFYEMKRVRTAVELASNLAKDFETMLPNSTELVVSQFSMRYQSSCSHNRTQKNISCFLTQEASDVVWYSPFSYSSVYWISISSIISLLSLRIYPFSRKTCAAFLEMILPVDYK